jgi:hypothetical protein
VPGRSIWLSSADATSRMAAGRACSAHPHAPQPCTTHPPATAVLRWLRPILRKVEAEKRSRRAKPSVRFATCCIIRCTPLSLRSVGSVSDPGWAGREWPRLFQGMTGMGVGATLLLSFFLCCRFLAARVVVAFPVGKFDLQLFGRQGRSAVRGFAAAWERSLLPAICSCFAGSVESRCLMPRRRIKIS